MKYGSLLGPGDVVDYHMCARCLERATAHAPQPASSEMTTGRGQQASLAGFVGSLGMPFDALTDKAQTRQARAKTLGPPRKIAHKEVSHSHVYG